MHGYYNDVPPLLRLVAVAAAQQRPLASIGADFRIAAASTTTSATSPFAISGRLLSDSADMISSHQLRRRNATSATTHKMSPIDAVGTGLESPPLFVHQLRKSIAAAPPPPAPGRLADVARTTAGLSSTRVQSLATVVVISAIFVFVTLTTTAVVAVLCCKRNSVFALQLREHRKSDQTSGGGNSDSDIEQCEMQDLEPCRGDDDDIDDGDDDYDEKYYVNDDDSLPADYYDDEESGTEDRTVDIITTEADCQLPKHRRSRCRRLLSKLSKHKSKPEVGTTTQKFRSKSALTESTSTTSLLNRYATVVVSTNGGSRTSLLADVNDHRTASGLLLCDGGSDSGYALSAGNGVAEQFWSTNRPAEGPLAADADRHEVSTDDDEHTVTSETRRSRKQGKRNVTARGSSGNRYLYRRLGDGSSDDEGVKTRADEFRDVR
jgi:hypothetical protein